MRADLADTPWTEWHGLLASVLRSRLTLDVLDELGDPLAPDRLGQVGPAGDRSEMELEPLAMGSIAGVGPFAQPGRPLAGSRDPPTDEGLSLDQCAGRVDPRPVLRIPNEALFDPLRQVVTRAGAIWLASSSSTGTGL